MESVSLESVKALDIYVHTKSKNKYDHKIIRVNHKQFTLGNKTVFHHGYKDQHNITARKCGVFMHVLRYDFT